MKALGPPPEEAPSGRTSVASETETGAELPGGGVALMADQWTAREEWQRTLVGLGMPLSRPGDGCRVCRA